MSQLKLITLGALFSLTMIGSASANPWVRYPRVYYRPYGPAVVVAPAPVIVAPHAVVASPYAAPTYAAAYAAPAYAAPVYAAPAAYAAPVYAAPAPVVYSPAPVAYGVVGPHGRLRPGFTPVGIYVR